MLYWLITFFWLQNSGLAVPRVLGLSASVVTSKVNIAKFMKEKEALEAALDAKVVTTDSENLQELLL